MPPKSYFLLLLLSIRSFSYSQTTVDIKLDKAFSFYDKAQYDSSYKYFAELKQDIKEGDSLYRHLAFGITASYYFMEIAAKNALDWKKTEESTLGFLKSLDEYKGYIDEGLTEKKYFAYKDLVLANFGLGDKKEAKEYQQILYDAYKKKLLPGGIDQYYNFDYFKWNGKNVWGYEWFAELGEPGTEGSFSKIVYYVYSTKPDGSDDEQLYRLHVLKIHKIDPDMKVDYVLTKRIETARNETSGTLWSYTYERPLDYGKIKQDILAVLEGKLQPDTKSVINKNE